MSNMVLVSVFDHAVGEYAPCMCVNSEAAAIRIFTNEVNRYDPNNLLSTNKSDFSLYVVGEFDLSGIGLHTGREVHLTMKPAKENTGFVFVRTDLEGKPQVEAAVS